MRWTILRHRGPRAAASLLSLCLVATLPGCGLLDVDDPTAILENELDNAQGAELLRRDVLRVLYDVSDDAAYGSGLLADEFFYQRSAVSPPGTLAEELLDMRASVDYEASTSYANWQGLWGRITAAALTKLKVYGPPTHVGEVLAIRGYAATHLAEHYCPGFPLHTVEDFTLTHGPPLSTEQALERALAKFDSALSWVADSARVLNFARVGRARALLNLGRFAEAGAAATEVPTGYVYQTEYSATINPFNSVFPPFNFITWGVSRSVANREGSTGLDFAAAQDPRVPIIPRGKARDGVTDLYALNKYPSRTSPIVLASGVEARLIQAEAALRANPGDLQWLTILNELRAPSGPNSGGVAGLSPLADPGTEAGRVDLLFRERAFWLFATGHRLGDLRRLVRQYNRPRESAFPTGAYWMGGAYGSGTSIPLPKQEIETSPGITGCTSR